MFVVSNGLVGIGKRLEAGATSLEYALVIGLIALSSLAAMPGEELACVLTEVSSEISEDFEECFQEGEGAEILEASDVQYATASHAHYSAVAPLPNNSDDGSTDDDSEPMLIVGFSTVGPEPNYTVDWATQ